MKRVKQYRIRLTEEEDELLKQKARKSGLSVADIIRLGIKYQIQDLESARAREVIKNSKFVENWEQNLESSHFQDFERWKSTLKLAYIAALSKYKSSVRYVDEKFEVVSSFKEIEEIDEAILVNEVEPETKLLSIQIGYNSKDKNLIQLNTLIINSYSFSLSPRCSKTHRYSLAERARRLPLSPNKSKKSNDG